MNDNDFEIAWRKELVKRLAYPLNQLQAARDKEAVKRLGHMPRLTARLFLKVTDVRAERLQDISGDDVLREGVENGVANPKMGARWENMQRMAFKELWDGLNAKRYDGAAAWAANPWVWVYEFERVFADEKH